MVEKAYKPKIKKNYRRKNVEYDVKIKSPLQ